MKRLLTLLLSLMMMVGASATDYDLWINGTRVTSDNFLNLSNINGVSGTVYFTDNTLHLSYALIVSNSSPCIKVGSGMSGLKIEVSGVSTIVNTSNTGMGMSLDNCGMVEITGNDGGILNIMGGKLSSAFDILFTGSVLRITDGVTVNLLRGGIYNDGYWNETLNVDNANLYVHRRNATTPCIYMQNLAIQNAHLAMPYWASHEWNGRELTSGSLSWHSDIYIKAGAPSEPYGYGVGSSGDANGDGVVTLSDVTALVNKLLGKSEPALEHEYVNLGLPSGTLWATCNIGATAPEEYGAYFAWGETVPYGQDDYSNATNYASMGNYTKTEFSWNTYKWSKGSFNTLTKYCDGAETQHGYNGFTDDKVSLDAVDDAAYVLWGSGWRIPTMGQWQELIDNCTEGLVTLNGVSVRGLTGPNGNILILPFAGNRVDTGIEYVGIIRAYWTRQRQEYGPTNTFGSYYAWAFYTLGSQPQGDIYQFERCCGLPIRPVRVQ